MGVLAGTWDPVAEDQSMEWVFVGEGEGWGIFKFE